MKGTVLVAEDEESVRVLIETVLRAAGFKVFAAASGTEAATLVKTIDGALDLLITDVVMPGMIGPDLARLVRERFPHTRAALHHRICDPFGGADGIHARRRRALAEAVFAGPIACQGAGQAGNRVMSLKSGTAKWWLNLPLRYKGLLVIALPVVGLVVTFLLRLPFTQQQQQTTALLERSSGVRNAAQEILVALLDVETGARGFALNGPIVPRPLPRCVGAHSQRARDAGSARRQPTSSASIEEVATRTIRRLELAREVVALAEREADAAALKEKVSIGKGEMDASRAAVEALLSAVQRRVDESQAELVRIRQRLSDRLRSRFSVGSSARAPRCGCLPPASTRRMAPLSGTPSVWRRASGCAASRRAASDEIGGIDRALRRASVMIRQRNRELRSTERDARALTTRAADSQPRARGVQLFGLA